MRPTFRHTYPLADQPHDNLRAWDLFLPQGSTLGRLSLAQDRLDRPQAHAHTGARQRPKARPRARAGRSTNRLTARPLAPQAYLGLTPDRDQRVGNAVTFPTRYWTTSNSHALGNGGGVPNLGTPS